MHAILGGSLTPSQRTLLPNPFLGEAFANHDTGEAPIILIVACSPRASKLAQLHSEGALHQHHPGTYRTMMEDDDSNCTRSAPRVRAPFAMLLRVHRS